MKEIIKKHPLRDIVLSFDLDITPLDFEEEGLAAYYRMHDATWQMRENLLTHQSTFTELSNQIADLNLMLLPIEQDLDILDVSLELLDESVLPAIEGEFTIKLSELTQSAKACWELTNSIYYRLDKERDWYNPLLDIDYQNQGWTSRQDYDLVYAIYPRFAEASVHTTFLDKDQNAFFDVYQTVKELEREHVTYADQVFKQYKEVLKRYNDMCTRAQRVIDHFPNENNK